MLKMLNMRMFSVDIKERNVILFQLSVNIICISSSLALLFTDASFTSFACYVYADYLLVGIYDAQHGLELHESHVSITPICNGILLSKHILVYGNVDRLMYQLACL